MNANRTRQQTRRQAPPPIPISRFDDGLAHGFVRSASRIDAARAANLQDDVLDSRTVPAFKRNLERAYPGLVVSVKVYRAAGSRAHASGIVLEAEADGGYRLVGFSFRAGYHGRRNALPLRVTAHCLARILQRSHGTTDTVGALRRTAGNHICGASNGVLVLRNTASLREALGVTILGDGAELHCAVEGGLLVARTWLAARDLAPGSERRRLAEQPVLQIAAEFADEALARALLAEVAA